MTRSKVYFVALSCSVVLALAGCSKAGDDDDGAPATGTGGMSATATGTGGMAATGTGGMGAATGTGGMAAGGAGMGAAANMPNAQCLATTMMMPCDNCACTPSAMNGCLDEL